MATISTVGFVGVGVGVVLLLAGGGSSNNAKLHAPQLAKRDTGGVKVQPFFGGTSAGVNGTF